MASFNFTNLARALAKAEIDFDTASFKVLLVSSVPTTTDTTGNKHTWIDRADVTNEITGTGYTAGGIAQASPHPRQRPQARRRVTQRQQAHRQG